MTSVIVRADSISPAGDRFTTLECKYPRVIHDQVLTHRLFSRNSSSLRAIPTKRLIEQVKEQPYVPSRWGKNKRGMQALEVLSEHEVGQAQNVWDLACKWACEYANSLAKLGVHKELVNRLISPFAYVTVLISSTEWDNFLALRNHQDAQHEIQELAHQIHDVLCSSNPITLEPGQWHLPFTSHRDIIEVGQIAGEPFPGKLLKISAARCARVSYLTHDGKRDLFRDLELYEELVGHSPVHSSPLEHVATPSPNRWWGNHHGWRSLRKHLGNEAVGRRPGMEHT